jgi:D-sedoheptulose 7-phosphate isomerase
MNDVETTHRALVDRIGDIAAASIDVKRRFFAERADDVARAALMMIEALRAGRKILLFGNGGSAADAQHIAAEFVNRYQMERPGLAAIALTTDTSILTSIANDTAFEEIFSRQIEALGQAGDVTVAITTSGRSANMIRGVEAARQRGLHTIGLLGKDGGDVKDLVDVPIIVPSDSTSRIQEVHITIGHILCELVEQSLYPQP